VIDHRAVFELFMNFKTGHTDDLSGPTRLMSIRFAAIAGGSGEVAFWHETDMPAVLGYVWFQG
jgi:hypothetical protein